MTTAFRRCPFGWRALLVLSAAILLSSLTARAETATPDELSWARGAFPDVAALGPAEGTPPARAVLRADGVIAGYLLSTRAVVQSKGFSGKPLDVLVAIGTDGVIKKAQLREHHEPILLIGVSSADLAAFVEQYGGLDLRVPVRLSGAGDGDGATVDAVAGATVSSLVMNDGIVRAARAVARSRGLLGGGELDFEALSPAGWQELAAEGSLVDLTVTVGAAEAALSERGARLYPEGVDAPPADKALIDLYFGLATPARVGHNLFGDKVYNRAMAALTEGDHLLFVGGTGAMSYKGTAYVRSGIFDRLQVVQGARTIALLKDGYQRVEELAIDDGPALRDLSLFTIRGDTGFDPATPWRLDLFVPATGADGADVRAVFAAAYELPARYRRAAPTALADDDRPLWVDAWQARRTEIAILVGALMVLLTVLMFQDVLVRRPVFYRWFRDGFLLFTLVWLGWIAGAQLSVLNVLTFLDSLRTGFSWDTFLLEPLIFILWGFVAVTMLFWARGVFCGWLCPFGALQELTARVGELLGLKRRLVPRPVHDRLVAVKFVVFLCLFGLSLGGIPFTQAVAEVEPFKTAIVLRFDRDWLFVLYAVALVAVSLFVPRAFCRYLCPLGAALALPARLHIFQWLKRRRDCGSPCQQCAASCPVQAIHRTGKINDTECIHCLHCQAYYFDEAICPPLLRQRKLLDRMAAAGEG
jgi:transcriptional regulator of nitric oxide reductase